MNQELMKDELHRTLKRVIDQTDEEALRFLINRGEMVLSEVSVAKGEEQPSVMRRTLLGYTNGPPMIFCGPF
jgi:hypothetical protein